MDRLEKALEKARKLRETQFANQPAGQGHTVRANEHPHTPVRPLVSEPIVIGEAQLERSRVLAHHTRSTDADIFRILRTQVLQILNKSGLRTLAVTSPNYGDGKTTVSLNLAISIALDLKQTVLLVDTDLRKPNLHEFLGLDHNIGLSDHLIDNVPLPDCLTRLSFDRLSILPAGRKIDHSSEVLGSPRMAALAQELKARYPDRLIIYDMPPVLAQDDPIAFLPHVEAALLIVRDGVTTVDELKKCLNILSNANIIGTVLNNARMH